MSILAEIESLLKKVAEIEKENCVLTEMNSRLQGTILAKEVEIEGLKKELKEWKAQYR